MCQRTLRLRVFVRVCVFVCDAPPAPLDEYSRLSLSVAEGVRPDLQRRENFAVYCETAYCDTAYCDTACCDTAYCDTACCDTACCDTAYCLLV
jgi:hypothetical protein